MASVADIKKRIYNYEQDTCNIITILDICGKKRKEISIDNIKLTLIARLQNRFTTSAHSFFSYI